MRQARRQLSPASQSLATQGFFRQLQRSGFLLKAQDIALYIGSDGELNPWPIAQQLKAQRKACYLPVICPRKAGLMHFFHADQSSPMLNNRFGIPEPDAKYCRAMKRQFLSLVLMPLVAFDCSGNRLGMGGGYYDRAFNQALWPYKTRRPLLVGIAHDFQRVDILPTESWDVPLDAVITERSVYRF